MIKFKLDDEFLQLLSKPWQKFFKKFNEIDILPNSEWKPVHQLAHFANRYQSHFGKRFSFSIKGAPSKCAEVYMVKRISAMLGTTNQKTLSEYIDWVFDTKIITSNRKVRSLGYFANTSFCNEFNQYKIEKNKISRSTLLPQDYKEIADNLGVYARTFGDLAFAKGSIDSMPTYKSLFNELYKVGFEFDMLKDIV